MNPLPNIWGEGAIFAFSGMDGATNPVTDFVATFGHEPCDLLIHTPVRRHLALRVSAEVTVATNDVLVAGKLRISFCAWHTIVGEGAQPVLSCEPGTPADAVVLAQRDNRFAVAYGANEAEARQRAEAGLLADFSAEIEKRLAVLPRTDRLLAKCLSVMRVNTGARPTGSRINIAGSGTPFSIRSR